MGGALMSELPRFYEVWVWLQGEEAGKQNVIVETVPPLTPMSVKGHCCRTRIFSWVDYQRIRYRRVTRREEKK